MTSLPEVNPNSPGAVSPEARFNRATQGVYELGSTFKPFTVAMAMEEGIIKSFGQQYNCPEVLPAYGHLVHDTHPFGRSCTVAEIMMESSNIGTAQIAKACEQFMLAANTLAEIEATAISLRAGVDLRAASGAGPR